MAVDVRRDEQTEAHELAERAIADRFAAWTLCTHLTLGIDDFPARASRCDRALVKWGSVTGFFEVKTSKYKIGQCPEFIVSASKIGALRALAVITDLPVFMVVRFACDTIGYFDVGKTERSRTVENWGRDDRGRASDRETGACFAWDQFQIVGGAG